jgi:hypothetical protein
MAYQPNNSSSSSSLSAAEKGQQICYVLENGVATPISASSANFSALNGQKQQILYLVPNSQQKNVQANQILVQPVQSITPLGVGDSPSTGEQTIAYLPQNVLIHANASSRRQIGTPPPPTDFSQMVIGSYATNSGELRPSPGDLAIQGK